MDKQAAEIERDIEGAKVERVGEGIKITFSSGILFDVDKADLKDNSRIELAELSTILNKYEDTNIMLAGHTDSTGSEEYNLGLSRRRAQSPPRQHREPLPHRRDHGGARAGRGLSPRASPVDSGRPAEFPRRPARQQRGGAAMRRGRGGGRGRALHQRLVR